MDIQGYNSGAFTSFVGAFQMTGAESAQNAPLSKFMPNAQQSGAPSGSPLSNLPTIPNLPKSQSASPYQYSADDKDERDGVSRTFAEDIVSRIKSDITGKTTEGTAEETALLEEQVEEVSVEGEEPTLVVDGVEEESSEPKSTEGLARSLESAVEFVRENFGDQAATATMGLIYKNIGEGDVTEESLSNGLVAALKFIDRNFGIEAGDKTIAFFNKDLNNSLNDFFENGLMEEFYAGPAPGAGAMGGAGHAAAMNAAMTGFAEKFGADNAEEIVNILDAALEEGGMNMASLKEGLEEAARHLAEKNGVPEDAGKYLSSLTRTLHDTFANAKPPHAAQVQQNGIPAEYKGVSLNVTV